MTSGTAINNFLEEMVALLWMTVTAHALAAQRQSLRDVKKLETAVVDHEVHDAETSHT